MCKKLKSLIFKLGFKCAVRKKLKQMKKGKKTMPCGGRKKRK
jgi:hypothetical protein